MMLSNRLKKEVLNERDRVLNVICDKYWNCTHIFVHVKYGKSEVNIRF